MHGYRSNCAFMHSFTPTLNERERDVREGERTEDERMEWIFCERKRERTTAEREGGKSQVERRERKLLKN